MPCEFPSFATLFRSRPAAHHALAFATHTQSMPQQASAAAKSAASSSTSPSSGSRAARPPRRAKLRQAGAADGAPAASPQPPGPDPRPSRPAPLVTRPPGAAKPAAAPASQQALMAQNGIDSRGLAQVCLLPLNPSPLWATALDKLLLAHLLRFIPAAPPRPPKAVDLANEQGTTLF